MFQKYQPKKPALNPFEETEEDNYQSPTSDDKQNPFFEPVEKKTTDSDNKHNINNSSSGASSNPFDDSEELDDTNPFSDKFDDSPFSSLDRKKKKKRAPAPPRSKSQTLPPQTTPAKLDSSEKLEVKDNSDKLPAKVKKEDKHEKKEKHEHKYVKSPKKKHAAPPRPVYQGSPPPSPKSKVKSRSITPPPFNQTGEESDKTLDKTPKVERGNKSEQNGHASVSNTPSSDNSMVSSCINFIGIISCCFFGVSN